MQRCYLSYQRQMIGWLAFACFAMVLSGCGDESAPVDTAAEAASKVKRGEEMLAHMQAHFDNTYSLPPELDEALERGEISQAEIDERIAKGEFPKFFQFKTPADLPSDLVWDDGGDLADIGSADAQKGGTLYLSLQDFPRTLRLFGPDSNGSFRPWILDDTRMWFGRRHPGDTSIDGNGNFRYFPGIAAAWARV